jgi:hypothetical protein
MKILEIVSSTTVRIAAILQEFRDTQRGREAYRRPSEWGMANAECGLGTLSPRHPRSARTTASAVARFVASGTW